MKCRTILLSLVCLAASFSVSHAALAVRGDAEATQLLSSYLRYSIVKQMPEHVESIVGSSNLKVAEQVRTECSRWVNARLLGIREGLESEFGVDSKSLFQSFVGKFAKMEANNDLGFLEALSRAMGMNPSSESYEALRGVMSDQFLAADLEAGADFLGEVQTWMDVQARAGDAPPLSVWMDRSVDLSGGGSSSTHASAVDPMEAAEGGFGAFVELPEEEVESPLDSFVSARKTKREKELAESKAGMDMIAEERRAWESAYAQKKQAAAEQEASGMKRQAEALAQVEEEAFQQRQRSWGNRLKKIVASAAGSFAGGVTGGIATRGTEEVINEIWP